ncbi:similar to An08g12160 [Aspergillus luchuensis]|uniref:Similar to An08g12160 n=1 Tax=Aspergillus kawachii TaxID=1069201 RepID=A0A146FY82_ASPKA|nr:similar to An08g12160 [Aspergillus luchuensis]
MHFRVGQSGTIQSRLSSSRSLFNPQPRKGWNPVPWLDPQAPWGWRDSWLERVSQSTNVPGYCKFVSFWEYWTKSE